MVFGRNQRNACIGLMAILLFSTAIAAVVAVGDLNLPTSMVTIEVSNATESNFDTTLSNVPSGYDVENETYAGWCVDVRTPMARSPAKHQVTLYSSLSAPGELAAEEWDMVNYILNHKQGTAQDVQQAIWNFVHMDGDGYTPTSDAAWSMVNDALANGEGFEPAYGQIAAAICYPAMLFPSEEVQVSIIEVTYIVIPEYEPATIALVLLMAAAIALASKKKLTSS